MYNIEWLNLAKTDASATDSQATFGADFIKGASIGIVTTLAAAYVLRKCCNKANDSENFQRV